MSVVQTFFCLNFAPCFPITLSWWEG